METNSDSLLIEQCKNGSNDAFTQLIFKYQQQLYGLCFRLTQNRHEAEDLYQRTFVRIYENIERYNGKAKFYTWAYRIGVNLWLDDNKRKKIVKFDSLQRESNPAIGVTVSEKYSDQEISVESKAEKEELLRKVLNSIKKLKPKYRLILTLRDIEGKSYEEIAKILRCGPGTVASRLARAREELRKILEPFIKEGKK